MRQRRGLAGGSWITWPERTGQERVAAAERRDIQYGQDMKYRCRFMSKNLEGTKGILRTAGALALDDVGRAFLVKLHHRAGL